MKHAYSQTMGVWTLFIDDLPTEMTWDWLLQIFRAEGEVVDVFVSQRRRLKSNRRFGFVRFKNLEEARNAVKNLNGVKIRGRSINVSFAKYKKDGRPMNESAPKEENKDREAKWRGSSLRKSTEGGRSYKDGVVEASQHKRLEDWEAKHETRMRNTGEERIDNNLHLKELVLKVREEFCKPVNMEKNKRKFGLLLTEAMIKNS